MYVNEIIFSVWLAATIFALFMFVLWLFIKICEFIKGTKIDISQLKNHVHILEERQRNNFKYIEARIDTIEADKCKGEKDEID